jgi:hypothetical protein
MTNSISSTSRGGASPLVDRSVYSKALSVLDKYVKSDMDADVGQNLPAERGRGINRHATAMTGPSAKASAAPRGSGFVWRIDRKPVSNEIETLKMLDRQQQAARLIA